MENDERNFACDRELGMHRPISRRDLTEIYWYAAAYFALALVTITTFHFRQRFALELGEAVVHDMRTELFAKLTNTPYKRFVEFGEGTHSIIWEKNRYELFEVVQQFLDEEYHRDR